MQGAFLTVALIEDVSHDKIGVRDPSLSLGV